MDQSKPRSVFAERALLPEGWAERVLVDIGVDGRIGAVRPGAMPGDVERVGGPLIPAMPNLHSHAFQRAMAGLAEVSGSGDDSFWTWREAMYRTVGLVSPEDVEAIAAKVYVEMLKGGFGAVAEFHYLHHERDGSPYADPAEMSRRVVAGAAAAGIGFTLLPVFYAHANFGGSEPAPAQRRFVHGVDAFLSLMTDLDPICNAAGATLGLAFHSLRAATGDEMRAILNALRTPTPVHIHVAEQMREVDDCIFWSGRRPVEWLLDEMPVDARWCIIHATHMDEAETARLARSGAVAGLCPMTEANLGDGIFPAVAYRAVHGRFGIGTDSHVSTSVAEELRMLEYGQRLRDQRRNRLADGPQRSVGRDIFDAALGGGARALGQPIGGIASGMTASFIVLDEANSFIETAKGDQILDRWLFALGDRAVKDVMIAGQWRIRDGSHPDDDRIDRAFRAALERLGRG